MAIIDFHRDRTQKNGILNHHEVVETYRFKPDISASNDHIFDHWKATLVDLKKFKAKPIRQMKTDKEKWIYLLKDAPSLKQEERTTLKKDPLFQRALERLETLSSDPQTRKAFESSINDQRDHKATLDAAENKGHQEGREEGLQEGRRQIALALLKQKLPVQKIAQATDLSYASIMSQRDP